MNNDIFRGSDKLLRSVARSIMDRRDRLYGWKQHRDAFLASARSDREALATAVRQRLLDVLVHAYETSPYYRDTWDAIGFRPSSSFRAEDIQALPFITKDIVRDKKSLMVSRRFRSNELELSHTGGTTGPPTSFYLDHACHVSRLGRQWGILELCGYRPDIRRGLVWGVHADLANDRTHGLKRWFREYAANQEALCCAGMNEQAMMDYHGRLLRFKPEVLYGYPIAMVQFATFIQERGLAPIKVKRIITTAERLNHAQRRRLQMVFEGEVFSLYCTRDYGCIGFECEMHDGFHVDTESVLVEITRNGRCVNPGESGEITITDLQNYGMPFIRSLTGDIGALAPHPCKCGSPLPLLTNLDGRVTDLVYRPDGSVVQGLMLLDLFTDIQAIRFAQFVQERQEELDVFLVVTSEYSDNVEKEAIREVRELLGSDIAINIRCVPEIARNPHSGKFQEVICKLSRQDNFRMAEGLA
jgi:phenylacetate-CoA ligase